MDHFYIISVTGMNRKRALVSDAFKVKKRRNDTEKFGASDEGGGECLEKWFVL